MTNLKLAIKNDILYNYLVNKSVIHVSLLERPYKTTDITFELTLVMPNILKYECLYTGYVIAIYNTSCNKKVIDKVVDRFKLSNNLEDFIEISNEQVRSQAAVIHGGRVFIGKTHLQIINSINTPNLILCNCYMPGFTLELSGSTVNKLGSLFLESNSIELLSSKVDAESEIGKQTSIDSYDIIKLGEPLDYTTAMEMRYKLDANMQWDVKSFNFVDTRLLIQCNKDYETKLTTVEHSILIKPTYELNVNSWGKQTPNIPPV